MTDSEPAVPAPPPPGVDGLQPPAPAPTTTAPSAARTRTRRRTWGVAGAVVVMVGLAAVAAWYFLIREPDPRSDLERFQGEWRLSHAWEQPTADAPVRNAVRVEGDRWQYLHGAGEGQAFTLTLNEQADPKEIDLALIETRKFAGAPVRMRGIYRFDGNQAVRVRFGVGSEPRPTSLDDPDAVVLVLTKVKLEPAPKEG